MYSPLALRLPVDCLEDMMNLELRFQWSKKQKVVSMGGCRNGACAWLWCGCFRFVPLRRLSVSFLWNTKSYTVIQHQPNTICRCNAAAMHSVQLSDIIRPTECSAQAHEQPFTNAIDELIKPPPTWPFQHASSEFRGRTNGLIGELLCKELLHSLNVCFMQCEKVEMSQWPDWR